MSYGTMSLPMGHGLLLGLILVSAVSGWVWIKRMIWSMVRVASGVVIFAMLVFSFPPFRAVVIDE